MQLDRLSPGMLIPFGGDRAVSVSAIWRVPFGPATCWWCASLTGRCSIFLRIFVMQCMTNIRVVGSIHHAVDETG